MTPLLYTALALAVLSFRRHYRRPERWVCRTPVGSQLGVRVYGSDREVVEQVCRL